MTEEREYLPCEIAVLRMEKLQRNYTDSKNQVGFIAALF